MLVDVQQHLALSPSADRMHAPLGAPPPEAWGWAQGAAPVTGLSAVRGRAAGGVAALIWGGGGPVRSLRAARV